MEPPTIISISQHGIKYTVEIAWDADISDVVEAFRGLLLAIGFDPEQIDDQLNDTTF